MKEFFAERIESEDGAETVEIIIGIVVFVVFGLAVFGMVTNVAGNKMQDISRCLGNSSTVIANAGNTGANGAMANMCNGPEYQAGVNAGKQANYNGGK